MLRHEIIDCAMWVVLLAIVPRYLVLTRGARATLLIKWHRLHLLLAGVLLEAGSVLGGATSHGKYGTASVVSLMGGS